MARKGVPRPHACTCTRSRRAHAISPATKHGGEHELGSASCASTSCRPAGRRAGMRLRARARARARARVCMAGVFALLVAARR